MRDSGRRAESVTDGFIAEIDEQIVTLESSEKSRLPDQDQENG
jgi:hypothetical protein